MELQVDISDDVVSARFGGKAWFIDDPRIVHVVREIRDGQPVILHYRYRNLNRRGLCTPFKRDFHLNPTMDYRCFYTGNEVYLTAGNLLGGPNVDMWKTPWALTREHVVPQRERNPALVRTLGNMVPCALFMNKTMAHIPLGMKLFERDYLHTLNFDRSDMSLGMARAIRQQIIEFEHRFWFVDNYPWFPHAIKDQSAKLAADDFFGYFRRHEEQFLARPWQEQRRYLDQPCDLDVPHLAKVILGLDIATMPPTTIKSV